MYYRALSPSKIGNVFGIGVFCRPNGESFHVEARSCLPIAPRHAILVNRNFLAVRFLRLVVAGSLKLAYQPACTALAQAFPVTLLISASADSRGGAARPLLWFTTILVLACC